MNLETIERTAKAVLQQSGKHYLQFIAYVKGKCCIIGAPIGSDAEKDDVMRHMRDFVQRMKPERYFAVTEAWYVVPKSEEDINVRPSDNPNRKEALCIYEFNRDLTSKGITLLFRRSGNRIVFTERHEMERPHTRMNFYLEDASDEHIELARKSFKEQHNKRGAEDGK